MKDNNYRNFSKIYKAGKKFFIRSRPILNFGLRLLIGVSIVIYLVKQGRLDLDKIALLWQQPQVLVIFLLVITVNNFLLSAWRYQVLLGERLIFSGFIIKLTMIGHFFNSTLPGVVTGDIVKGYYLKKLHPEFKKSDILFSLFCDRLAGLVGLLLFSFGCLLVLYANSDYHYHPLHLWILLLSLGFSGVYVFLLLPITKRATVKFMAQPYCPSLLRQKELGFWPTPKALLFALAISFFIFTTTIFLIYYGSLKLGGAQPTFSQQALAIPIGLIAIAIPISPGGIGIGHAAFDFLYQSYGFSGGGDVFNIFVICQLMVNLSGLIPYLLAVNKYER